jgi:hypothetical protein
MDAMLLTVTGISLALAAGMGVLLARMLRDERRRSDARVALLSELAGEPAAAAVLPPAPLPRRAVETRAPTVRIQPARASEPFAREASSLDDFALHADLVAEETSGSRDLFHEQEAASPWPRRLAVAGGMAAVIVVLFLGLSTLGGDATEGAAANVAAATPETAPLELLSLRHSQENGMLTISGMVQNPKNGKALSQVKATLFVFGPGGSFITSGRAPIDFTALGPGEESPFVVRVPVSGEVARYRVGFRGDDDRVLAHVDRRSADAIAQK